MSTFMIVWTTWAHLFSALPYGDPYGAAFGAVAIAVMIIKTVKSAMRHV